MMLVLTLWAGSTALISVAFVLLVIVQRLSYGPAANRSATEAPLDAYGTGWDDSSLAAVRVPYAA